MFSCLTALLFAIFLSSGQPSLAQAKLYADCTFGNVKSWEQIDNKSSVMKLSGQLPSSRSLSHSCVVKTDLDNKNSLLYLRAKRNEESRKGSLHLSVYRRDESALQGHLDIAKSALGQHWSSLPFCPSRSANEVEKYFTFSGTPGLTFTLELSQDQLLLNDPKTFEISQRDPIYVFQFIPPEDISKTQLDVTVTSDSDVPAYLKVSRDCKDVKENIRLVDYKGESIRLSFAKKGRITLSTESIPPLTDSTSSWFIGIALNNALGTTQLSASKTVKLTLKRSFDYSYLGPILFIFFVPLSCGVVVAFWALNCFKEPHVNPHVNDAESQPIASITLSVKCCDGSVWKAMPKMVCQYWFRGENNTFSYITAIVGWVLFVGALQFVFANWYLMILEGDRDSCYYNDFCYRVWKFDIPFNLMISNFPYIIHAFILAVSVLYMEAELFVRCKKLVEATKPEGENQNAEGERQNIEGDENLAEETKTEGEKRNAEGETERRNTEGDGRSAEATQTKRKKRLKAEGERQNDGGDKNRAEAIQTEGEKPDPEGERQNAEGDKKRHKATQTEDSKHERLPNHVLKCPNIAPHLATMSVPHVPQHKLNEEDYTEAHKRKFSFSIGYAFAWALFFEGMFSALYHLCPSRMTFQFDTAFMFVIAGLIVILLYNGIKLEECPNEGQPKGPVGAANFFLGFIAPLYFFNYFGSLYHSQSGLIPLVKILFFIFLPIWCIMIAIWAGVKLYIPKKKKERQGEGSPEQKEAGDQGEESETSQLVQGNGSGSSNDRSGRRGGEKRERQGEGSPEQKEAGDQGEESETSQVQGNGTSSSNDRSGRGGGEKDCCLKCFFFFLGLAAPIVLLTLWLVDNFSEAFLFTCIVESGIVLLWKATKKICYCCCNSSGNMTKAEKCRMVFQVLFILATLVIGGFAVGLFIGKPSTNKTKTPEKSRDLNHECVAIGGFFDNHDLWHILSSFALLMGAYLVMFISYEPTSTGCADKTSKRRQNSARESLVREPQKRGVQNTGYANDQVNVIV